MTRALVFAYHDVGVRCLQILLANRVEVGLVVTHEDAPSENIWFGSVAALARGHGIPVVTPEDPNTSAEVLEAAAAKPDFVFSFYYRHLLGKPVLQSARLGALNMHGSLLPKYRGRAPVNWAVINGESRTGATLHYMESRPDAGDIVDQLVVPILADETAVEVFRKVTSASATVLDRNLDALMAGTARRIEQDDAHASYFGRRTPQDGRINWNDPAARIHNLVRGVAPPYPGAFSEIAGEPVRVLRTARTQLKSGPCAEPFLFSRNGYCFAQCGDGAVLQLAQIEWRGRLLEGHHVAEAFVDTPLPLVTTSLEMP